MNKWEKDRIYSTEEYFSLVEEFDEKIEYHDGRIYDMAGGSARHSIISTNLLRALGNALANRNCTVFNSDLQLAISQANRYVYPDAMVACGEPEYRDERQLQLLNPVLIAEVQSPSTKGFDKWQKFPFYRILPSFQEFLVIDSEGIYAEVYYKEEEGLWRISSTREANESLRLHSLEMNLPIRELYLNPDYSRKSVNNDDKWLKTYLFSATYVRVNPDNCKILWTQIGVWIIAVRIGMAYS